jgi:hypothetical protein
MSKQLVNTGKFFNDSNADPVKVAFEKVNNNFDELYGNYIVLTQDTYQMTEKDSFIVVNYPKSSVIIILPNIPDLGYSREIVIKDINCISDKNTITLKPFSGFQIEFDDQFIMNTKKSCVTLRSYKNQWVITNIF